MQIYEVSITKIEAMQRLISKFRKEMVESAKLFNKCSAIPFINEAKT